MDSSPGYGYLRSILIPVWERPLAGLPTVFKRGMDITGSAITLALTLPLMGLIAALIKLDSPVRCCSETAVRVQQKAIYPLQIPLYVLRSGG